MCNEDDISEGEIKEFKIGAGKVLLTKYNGVLSAVGAKCTHYGAPLITGSYSNGRVRCPWHGACFSTTTGDIEDFPGVDSLHKFEVCIEDGKVVVTADDKALTDFRRVKEMTGVCSAQHETLSETFLIIGGGVAALLCAETLRQEGFSGELIMARQEAHPPYDRPKLSKMLNATPASLYLRDEDFLKEKKITSLHAKAVHVDTANHIVTFADNSTRSYNKLFVATGGRPRQLNVAGSNLANICYLRSPEDANIIHESSPGKNIVVLGTGFIGMEVAASLVSKANSVSVVGSGRTKIPFEKLLGEKIGKMFLKLHKDKGVEFYLDHGVKEIQGVDGKVSSVVLTDGTSIPADVVIAGIGVVPSTEMLQNTDVKLDKAGNLVVDEFLYAGHDVYGGGDIVSFPYCYDEGKQINIGHWQLASAHGRCAALNMMGKKTPIRTIPFFWSGQFGKSLRYAGHCTSFDEIVYEGDVDEMKFTAYYCRENKVYSVAAMNMGAKVSELAFKLQDGTCPPADELRR